MEEDQGIAQNMFVYAKLVNDLRFTDEQERKSRTSFDYSSTAVTNSSLSRTFQVPLPLSSCLKKTNQYFAGCAGGSH